MHRKPAQPESSSGPARDSATPRKRFRIERLEERIAPKKGGKGTHNCSGSSNTISGSNYY
jgi:hypothetical protein